MWIRRHWRAVAAVALLPVVCPSPLVWLLHGTARASAVGFALASAIWLAVGICVLWSGTTSQIMGAPGESLWTATLA